MAQQGELAAQRIDKDAQEEDNMDYKEMLIGFAAGTIPGLIPLFKRTKRESDAILLELIQVLRGEIERVRKQVEQTEEELKEVKNSYAKLQEEYDTLLKKYNQLKADFTNYKNKQGHDIPS